jgi:predicted RND superfamily exporter protein
MHAWVESIFRRSRLVIFLAIVLSVPAAYFSAKLYGNLKPDLEELLPRQSRSILDLDEIRARLKSTQRLDILVYSDHTDASKRFILDLAQKLEALTPHPVASVEYRIDRELKYFGDRRSLFLEQKDLQGIRDYIRERVSYERELYNPLNIVRSIEIPEPQFDFELLKRKYDSQAQSYDRYPKGFYATPDEKIRLLLAYVPAELSGVNGVREFKAKIDAVIAELKPQSYSPDIVIRFTGAAQDVIEEFDALMGDIENTAQIVFTVVVLAILVFFRSVLATVALLGSLFMARFWTFGISWFLIGSLNANSAFMGSIVLGSGITFGVMLLARYLEERRRGLIPLQAASHATVAVARATLTASLTTGAAYGSLYFTEFEGFKQYGVMGLLGMMLCWLSSVLVLPALLVEIEKFKLIVKPGVSERPSWFFGPYTRVLGRHPGKFLIASVALSIFSLVSLTRFDAEEMLEKNLSNLRNKMSLTKGAWFYGQVTDKILGTGSASLIVLAHTQEDALKISEVYKERKRKEGEPSEISSVGDISTFVPAHQEDKIKVLREIDRILPEKLRSRLEQRDRKKAEELLNPAGFQKIEARSLPKLVQDKFMERDGALGRLVIVDPRWDSGMWSGAQLNAFVEYVRGVADQVEGRKVPVAGVLTVTSDMIASIIRDGPKASMLAFFSVVLIIMALFRKPRIVGLMLSGLVLGNLWMFGIVIASGLKINFLNFIASPITFGIGIDYAVNLFDRYLHDPDRDILRVVRETGGAVGLCSFTTVVGYGALLVAQNQAFVSFGALAVLGELTSMLAAVVALPALILWSRGRKSGIQAP